MHSDSQITIENLPPELVLTLCEFIGIRDLANLCTALPKWRWILHSPLVENCLFLRPGFWMGVDRHLSRMLFQSSSLSSFEHRISLLEFHAQQQAHFDHISRIQFDINLVNSLQIMALSSSHAYIRKFRFPELLNWRCSIIGHSIDARIKFRDRTTNAPTKLSIKLNCTGSEPGKKWAGICRKPSTENVKMNDAVGKRICRYPHGPNASDLAHIDAVIYFVNSTKSLRDEIAAILNSMKIGEILLLVIQRHVEEDYRSDLECFSNLINKLGGLENLPLASSSVYWFMRCLDFNDTISLNMYDLLTWVRDTSLWMKSGGQLIGNRAQGH